MSNSDYYNLIISQLTGEISQKEQQVLQVWLNASTKNQQIFFEVEKIWQQSKSKAPTTVPDIDQAWQEMEEILGSEKPSRRLSFKQPRMLGSWISLGRTHLIAAAVMLSIVFGSVFYFSSSWRFTEIKTQKAQRKQVTLPDGSLVHLNVDSKIYFPKSFENSERNVWLSGEAYFEVVPDKQPFIVQTKKSLIRVLGTKFNVRSRGNETRVAVREGRVSFELSQSNSDDGVILQKNQMSACGEDSKPAPPVDINIEQFLSWLDGKIIFKKTPLAEIVSELHRIFNVPIEITRPELGQLTITGSFREKSLESILSSICLAWNLQWKFSSGKYIISN